MVSSARFEALLATRESMLAASGRLEEFLDAVVEKSLGVIPGADGAVVTMRDNESREARKIVCRAASGPASRWIGRKFEIEHSIAGLSMLAHTPRICQDVEKEQQIDPAPYRDVGMRAVMSVPLLQQGRSIGALKYYSNLPDAFAAADLTAAGVIATQLTCGLIAQAHDDVARARQTDAARFEALAESQPQLVWSMTAKGVLTYCNRRMLRFIGVDRVEDFDGNILAIIDPAFHDEVRALGSDPFLDSAGVTYECRMIGPGRSTRWMLVNVVGVPAAEVGARPREWIGAAVDIDERKGMEIALRDAVRGRDLLLHEVNHRVKNSLQMVIGLLSLHASRIAHPEARARLMDARTQVSTIAQIHQSIYQTSQHDHVEFVGFLKRLAAGLVGRGANSVADLVFLGVDELPLPIARGVPVALIVGEIVTNAVKHATGGEDPRIVISIQPDDQTCVIDVTDNGPGLPADFTPAQTSTLGMEIIFGLAQQAGGRIEIDSSSNGARFRLILPNYARE